MSSPPDYMQLEWLMTDGSVLAQSGSNWSNFYLLTPDSTGNYANGTWTQVGSLQSGYGPDAFASATSRRRPLRDHRRRVQLAGNGYDLQLTNLGAVYDPVENDLDAARTSEGLGLHRRFALERSARTDAFSSVRS